MDDLERVIRPIVEGQIRSYFNDHPSVLADRHDARQSLAKRIIGDLLCAETRARLAAALASTTGSPSKPSVVAPAEGKGS